MVRERLEAIVELKDIVESAPVALVMVDAAGQIALANFEAETLFGYSRDELLGSSVDMLVAPESRHTHRTLRTSFLARPSARRMGTGQEILGVKKDGTAIALEIGLRPLATRSGLYVLSTIADITQRKRLDQRFRAMVESAPLAMLMTNHAGRIVLVNPATEQLFGYDHGLLIGQQLERLLPERFRQHHRRYREHFANNPKARRMGEGRDLFALRADGSEFPVEIGLNPIETEEGNFVLSVVADITERQQAAEAQARLAAIVESSQVAIIGATTDGTITSWNHAAHELYGYSAGEVLGRSLEILVPNELMHRYRSGLSHLLRGDKVVHADTTDLGKHGVRLQVAITVSPILGSTGKIIGLSRIVADISTRKSLEAALRSANARLTEHAHDLQTQADTLRRTNSALEQSNLDLKQFAYVASHDLQAPLRGIRGFVQLLEERYEPLLDEDGRQWIGHIVRATDKLQGLIHDLLGYARLESTNKALEPVDLGEIVDDVLELLGPAAAEHKAHVTRSDLPTLVAERGQLHQLFENLIVNALNYRGNQPPRIHIEATPDNKHWLFAITDNGIGIDPKHHSRVFEIFRRLHSDDARPGTGIGLAICRRVVERHGGRIWLDSEPDQGTTVFFTLPAGAN